jgi:GrpB-like predicted nucleotidyltransferase (UPF0157 family)
MADKRKTVQVVEYDPAWPGRFRSLAQRAADAVGELAIAVEHVGSTSVPGLPAKPIIDLVVVVQPGDVPRAIERLVAIGYAHRGDLGIAGREAFRPPQGDEPHHVYVCVPDNPAFRDHVLFRDHLRAHPETAREYAELKRRLAEQFRHDSEGYQLEKKEFIDTVTRRAAAEASG